MTAGFSTGNDGGAILAVRALRKRFGDRIALDGVSFSMKPGEILGYVGPNGAGKTTTLRILTGTEAAFEGELSVHGHPMPAQREQVYSRLGYMPQAVAFSGWRTASETLNLLGRLSGMKEGRLAKRVPEVLAAVGLAGEAQTRLQAFSGGMRQRLGLAQAILHEPALLVLDEPFNHLDPTGRVHLKQLLSEMNARGVSIIFSSHILTDVEEIVHRLAVLQHGKLKFLGTPSELRTSSAGAREIEIGYSGGGEARKILAAMAGISELRPGRDQAFRFTVMPGESSEAVTTHALQALIAAGFAIRHVTPITPGLEEIISKLGDEEAGA
jgi:ABC-2 type transport system ATP-binding protein